jgi:hypothetical protein
LGDVSIENHCEASPRSAEISSFTGIEFTFTTALKSSPTGMRAINIEFAAAKIEGIVSLRMTFRNTSNMQKFIYEYPLFSSFFRPIEDNLVETIY